MPRRCCLLCLMCMFSPSAQMLPLALDICASYTCKSSKPGTVGQSEVSTISCPVGCPAGTNLSALHHVVPPSPVFLWEIHTAQVDKHRP
ncbi:hypothetical protein C8Q77DRAFT_1113980 [Trametes polyzona]|nr:hypothetical protein C8Q77DRAFT_1113980 [Trametes polyzona]